MTYPAFRSIILYIYISVQLLIKLPSFECKSCYKDLIALLEKTGLHIVHKQKLGTKFKEQIGRNNLAKNEN